VRHDPDVAGALKRIVEARHGARFLSVSRGLGV
jgi:hypothetical protein